MKISEILDDIDTGALQLPVFQRGYVWKEKQVKKLMQSLYRGFPVGSLLIWGTLSENVAIRGDQNLSASGSINLLLDGQQRVTSLYGVIRGTPPQFFEGDASIFSGLYFHLRKEEFEFHSASKMTLDPLWVNVTELFETGAGMIAKLATSGAYSPEELEEFINRMSRINGIKTIDIPDQRVTGADKDTKVVVEIFNEINSNGTKLSSGDLVLARISSHWPDAREEMMRRLQQWKSVRLKVDHDTLLRCVAAVVDGSYNHEDLPKRTILEIQSTLSLSATAINILLDTTKTYLGMDPGKIDNTKQAFPILVKYLVDNDNNFPSDTAKAQILHWYVSSSTWGHFSGATPNRIDRDLSALKSDDPISALHENLRQDIGKRTVGPGNFNVTRNSKRFYSLLRILSLAGGAKDWSTGKLLPDHADSPEDRLEWHHIFPQKVLRDAAVPDDIFHNLGNLSLQTRKTNRAIGDEAPINYLKTVAEHHPDVLGSQWVPDDRTLWSVDRYRNFLEARHQLLADAANEFLNSLNSGNLPAPIEQSAATDADGDEDQALVEELNAFVQEQGLALGELGYEIVDPSTNELIATLNMAWPDGVQAGLSDAIAVLIDEDNQTRKAANDAGFTRLFTGETASADFRRYVTEEILDATDDE